MLRIKEINVNIGGIPILKNNSLEVETREIVAAIGPNGAGKTTLLRAISGLIPLISGIIEFGGVRIDGLKPHEVAKLRVAHVPERGRLFNRMTVFENLQLGAYLNKDSVRKQRNLQMVYGYFPILEKNGNQIAATLSGGERQMLSLGRALMGEPKLMLVDEPTLGLAPLIIREVMNILTKLNGDGISILLVEQNAMALEIANRAYVLELGRIVLHGKADEVKINGKVRNSYLGIG